MLKQRILQFAQARFHAIGRLHPDGTGGGGRESNSPASVMPAKPVLKTGRGTGRVPPPPFIYRVVTAGSSIVGPESGGRGLIAGERLLEKITVSRGRKIYLHPREFVIGATLEVSGTSGARARKDPPRRRLEVPGSKSE